MPDNSESAVRERCGVKPEKHERRESMIKVGIPSEINEGYDVHYMPAVPASGDWITINHLTRCVSHLEWIIDAPHDSFAALVHFRRSGDALKGDHAQKTA